ncbi:MAG: glycosyltransferase [Planctomycetota bacterium]
MTVIMTVKNDVVGCDETLTALFVQSRQPGEIIVVDGGSTDGTRGVIARHQTQNPRIRLIEAVGANISRGRNIATEAATTDLIACTDGGCRPEPTWLQNLVRPIEREPEVEFIAGSYRIAPQSLLEDVVGLCTMRGQLEPVSPSTFNPSGRSMAYRKSLWERAGGWPEWLQFSEDTLFDHKIRRLGAAWRFASDAIVNWRPRTTLCAIARQFYNYGTGRGHTQIGARDFGYNLRNLWLLIVILALCFVHFLWIAVFALLAGYFYGWTFHERALRVSQRTHRRLAYPLTFVVMWVVLFSNLAGFVVGCWQRFRQRGRMRWLQDSYLADAPSAGISDPG